MLITLLYLYNTYYIYIIHYYIYIIPIIRQIIYSVQLSLFLPLLAIAFHDLFRFIYLFETDLTNTPF